MSALLAKNHVNPLLPEYDWQFIVSTKPRHLSLLRCCQMLQQRFTPTRDSIVRHELETKRSHHIAHSLSRGKQPTRSNENSRMDDRLQHSNPTISGLAFNGATCSSFRAATSL